jgi:hypothetical protein
MNAINVPVTITPEAANRIAELGFEQQMDQMLEYARQNLPELVRLEIDLNLRYDSDAPPGVFITAWSSQEDDPTCTTWNHLVRWATTTFPPEVLEHLHLSFLPGAEHEG